MHTIARGHRLLPAVIEQIAKDDPDRAWAMISVDDHDSSKGFTKITFHQLKIAADCMAYYLELLFGRKKTGFPTFSYSGPKDIRYAIIAIAAAKVGRTILLVSPWARPAAQKYLVEATDCRHMLYAEEVAGMVEKNKGLGGMVSIPKFTVPSLHNILALNVCLPNAYDRKWETAYKDPWIIFHTSGTTADPKPVVYTQAAMSSIDAHSMLRDPGTTSWGDLLQGRHVYAPLPALHIGGMLFMLKFPVWLGTVAVVGSSTQDATDAMNAVLRHGHVECMLLTPAYIKLLTDQPDFATRLHDLKVLLYCGAPLPRSIGDRLPINIKIQSMYGSTESGLCQMRVRNDDEWEYCSFMSAENIAFKPIGDGRHELVFHKAVHPKLGLPQQVFQLHPSLQQFESKDLFKPHPTKSGLWKYVGRIDDMIKFIHGESLHATELEQIFLRHECVSVAAVGGQGRSRPCALIQLTDEFELLDSRSKLHMVSDAISDVNNHCSELVKIHPGLVLFTTPDKPLPVTEKGNVSRTRAFALYNLEVDMLYASFDIPS